MAQTNQPRGVPTALRKGQARTEAMIAAMIPVDVAKQLDAEEFADRLVAAGRLLERARGATGVVANGFGVMARDLLRAQPRKVTATQVRGLMVKSASADSADERDRWRAAAERVKAEHPMAPRRRPPILKADVEAMVAVYDANGELVGMVPREKIQPVVPISRGEVTKARAKRRPTR